MTDEVQSAPAFAVGVATHGELPDGAGHTRAKIGSLGRLFASPASRAHVSVTRRRDPAVEHPVVARANHIDRTTALEPLHLTSSWAAGQTPETCPTGL